MVTNAPLCPLLITKSIIGNSESIQAYPLGSLEVNTGILEIT